MSHILVYAALLLQSSCIFYSDLGHALYRLFCSMIFHWGLPDYLKDAFGSLSALVICLKDSVLTGSLKWSILVYFTWLPPVLEDEKGNLSVHAHTCPDPVFGDCRSMRACCVLRGNQHQMHNAPPMSTAKGLLLCKTLSWRGTLKSLNRHGMHGTLSPFSTTWTI